MSKNASYNDRVVRTVGGVLIGAGALVGPSVGNFYAGDRRRGGRGILLRLGGGALMYAGIASALSGDGSEAPGTALFLGGATLTGVSALWNISTAPKSAREYNREHGVAVSVTPRLDPATGQTGAALSVRF